ncbi:protein containing Glycosyl transferase, group 1 domain, partial [sediment metagenome]
DLHCLMRLARLLMLTSEIEAFPNVVLEAHWLGTPVVATQVGDVPEMVDHGITGWLAPIGDIDALTAYAARLLTDAKEAQRMGELAQQRVRSRFSQQAMAKATLAIYHEQLACKTRVLDERAGVQR